MKINAIIAAAILAYTSGVSAHVRLTNPVPFTNVNQDPLNEGGADYPCGADTFTVGTMNEWAVGTTQEVSMIGTAVHSGGSCQFAFTTDEKPTPSSEWKVIHSVIGGCPMNAPDGVDANAEGIVAGVVPDANWPIPNKFPITIPKDTPNGRVTFAWVWFNKTGNREMYMKCAPVTISGGASNADDFNKRPSIFKANIGNGCTTTAGVNVIFPDPGESVETLGTVGASGYSGSCGSAGPSAPQGEGPAPAPASPPAPGPEAPAAPAAPPAPAAPAAPSGGNCGADGSLVCFSATEFGICSGGSAIAQAVAAGTTCSNGAIVRRSVPLRFARQL